MVDILNPVDLHFHRGWFGKGDIAAHLPRTRHVVTPWTRTPLPFNQQRRGCRCKKWRSNGTGHSGGRYSDGWRPRLARSYFHKLNELDTIREILREVRNLSIAVLKYRVAPCCESFNLLALPEVFLLCQFNASLCHDQNATRGRINKQLSLINVLKNRTCMEHYKDLVPKSGPNYIQCG